MQKLGSKVIYQIYPKSFLIPMATGLATCAGSFRRSTTLSS